MRKNTSAVCNSKRARLREVVTTIILTPIALLWVYPFLWMVSAAFKTNDEIFRAGTNIIPAEISLVNFERAWVQAQIGLYFSNTLIIALGSVLLVVATTSMMGYALGRYRFPGRRLVIGILWRRFSCPKAIRLSRYSNY